MSIASTRLSYEEISPRIEKLHAGRIRVVRRFFGLKRKDVEGSILDDRIFEAFNSLDGAKIGAFYDQPIPEKKYANCKLISQQIRYTPESSDPILEKVYETLTDSWVEEVDDVKDYGEDGLEQITRVLIADPGTDTETGYVVGLDTYEGQTLKQKRIEFNEGFTRMTLVYSESGITQTTTETRNNGKLSTITIVSEGTPPATPPGYTLVSDRVSNENGYPTYTYTFVRGLGRISETVETSFNGALTTSTIVFFGSDDKPKPNGDLIRDGQVERDGYIEHSETYRNGDGSVSDDTELRNNNKLSIRRIVQLGSPPSTPSGFVLTDTNVRQRDGYIEYSYSFARGDGEIDTVTDEVLGGNASTSNRLRRQTIRYLTTPSVISDPTTSTLDNPTKTDERVVDNEGYRLWTVTYVDGLGELGRRLNTLEGTDDSPVVQEIRIVYITAIESGEPEPDDVVGFEKVSVNSDIKKGYREWRFVYVKGLGDSITQSQRGPAPGTTLTTTIEYSDAPIETGNYYRENRELSGYYRTKNTELSGLPVGTSTSVRVAVPKLGTVEATTESTSNGSIAVSKFSPGGTEYVTGTRTVGYGTAPSAVAFQPAQKSVVATITRNTTRQQRYYDASNFIQLENVETATQVTTRSYSNAQGTGSSSGSATVNYSVIPTGPNSGTLLTETTTTAVELEEVDVVSQQGSLISSSSRPLYSLLDGSVVYEFVQVTV